MHSVLSAEQIEQYNTDGFTRVGRVLDDRQIVDLREAEAILSKECLAAGRVHKGRTHFISQVAHLNEAVRQFCMTGPQVSIARDLTDPNLCLWFTQFVTKHPDQGTRTSAFPWHQDNGYSAITPARNMTFWVALDDVDERNGCIWVKRGSHRLGLQKHESLPSGDSWYLQVDVPGEEVPVPLRAGEAIAFTGLTVHASKYNDTDHPRRAFFMEYAWADAWMEVFNIPVIASQHSWMVSGRSTIWGTISPVATP